MADVDVPLSSRVYLSFLKVTHRVHEHHVESAAHARTISETKASLFY